jgi:hypothetical protein
MADGRRKRAEGRWQMEEGRRKRVDGRWKKEEGRWKMEVNRRRIGPAHLRHDS